MLFDLPLEQLRDYRPEVAEPADFEDFWRRQLDHARSRDLAVAAVPVDTSLVGVQVFDVTFAGYGGDPVKAWLLLPRAAAPGAATVVEFVGYQGGRGDPLEWLTWSAAGHPHLVVDLRGQGGGWRSADTADPSDDGSPSTRGFLTRGIGSPQNLYYTRAFVDAARAVEVAGTLAQLAGRRVLTTGGSQGGALALAAAHLAASGPVAVAACLPDVPFLSHIRRGTEVTDSHPYAEVAEYLKVHPDRVEAVFGTLAYVDVVNHAKRVDVPSLFSVGLADEITPPSTVFAAYNHYRGPKRIEVYSYNGHEGGGVVHLKAKLAFARSL
ncbi:acetylxylan esterase [Angustibacter sp. McL0619]|uniref:acetylxylan esterase n=1 Tax=Angustibacter sp. McL0619 TaxID=3415676 RepID=UPI003CEE9DFE